MDHCKRSANRKSGNAKTAIKQEFPIVKFTGVHRKHHGNENGLVQILGIKN